MKTKLLVIILILVAALVSNAGHITWTSGTGGAGAGAITRTEGSGTSFNPADSTTYYLQWTTSGNPQSARNAFTHSHSLAGNIIRLCVDTDVITVLGSAEDVVITLLKNEAATALAVTLDWDTADGTLTCDTGSIAVALNDRLELEIVTPAWATNPTGVRIVAMFDIQQ